MNYYNLSKMLFKTKLSKNLNENAFQLDFSSVFCIFISKKYYFLAKINSTNQVGIEFLLKEHRFLC